tara:strand:+ start:308 stop:514 length:207 start_codon:yes stop_codon:yes gene_type:complete
LKKASDKIEELLNKFQNKDADAIPTRGRKGKGSRMLRFHPIDNPYRQRLVDITSANYSDYVYAFIRIK